MKFSPADPGRDGGDGPKWLSRLRIGRLNAMLSHYDEAYKWMKYESHHAFIAWVAVIPEYEGMHGDPRFQEFVERLDLPD